jgi:ribosomal protein S18 acetylase RimI-like enzyme
MQVLRPINHPEFAAWLEAIVPSYAADKVALHRWTKEESLELARKEYDQLLPKGLETENNFFFAVLDESGHPVGSLWFVEAPRVGYKVAYVFDIIIKPEHRRHGHAIRALEALEVEAARRGLAGVALQVFGHNHEARSLYSKLGYEPTNINLYKRLAARA